MIPANVKDLIDTIASVGTVVGFITAGILWYISRRDSQEKAETAIAQINLLATNHFPHMEQSLARQDELMHSIDVSLKTIADNSRRRREDF